MFKVFPWSLISGCAPIASDGRPWAGEGSSHANGPLWRNATSGDREKNIRADLVFCSLYLSDLSSACDLGSLNLTDLRVLLAAVSLDWRKMPV